MEKAFTELSYRLFHQFPGQAYSVASLPVGMKIVEDQFVVAERIPTIAVLDFFHSANVRLVSGVKVCHGEIVARYAVQDLQQKVGVLAFDLEPPGCASYLNAMIHAFEDLVKVQRQFHNIVALNISVDIFGRLEDIEYLVYRATGRFPKEITVMSAEKERLLAYLGAHLQKRKYEQARSGSPLHEYRTAYRVIQAINQLVDDGVKVYLASGNLGDDQALYWFSLSNAQYIVSAHDIDYCNKAFSTVKARGCYYFKKQFDESGKLACVTDGHIEFLPEELPEKVRIKRWFDALTNGKELRGTSFACPAKLNADLQEILKETARSVQIEEVPVLTMGLNEEKPFLINSEMSVVQLYDRPDGSIIEWIPCGSVVKVNDYDRTKMWNKVVFRAADGAEYCGFVRTDVITRNI